MDVKEIRRARLRLLILSQHGGNQTAFARVIGRQPDYVSRCLSGKKNLGDTLAREIEEVCGLSAYWLDGVGTERPAPGVCEPAARYAVRDPDEAQLLADYAALPEGWQYYLRHKAAELRSIADALPKFLSDSLRPIPPEGSYRDWERKLERFVEDQIAQRKHPNGDPIDRPS